MSESPNDVLDIGCGTGLAAVRFLERGCRVVGVEPDWRMAEVARQRGITVEVARFEEWDRRGRQFDLAICAQAWHWIDPTRGPKKLASALRPGGRFGVFWNLLQLEDHTKETLLTVYQRAAPALADTSTALGNWLGGDMHAVQSLADSRRFGAQESRRYAWQRVYSTTEWLDLLPTHSDHRLLPSDQLAALLDGISDALGSLGGAITVTYKTFLLTGRRRVTR